MNVNRMLLWHNVPEYPHAEVLRLACMDNQGLPELNCKLSLAAKCTLLLVTFIVPVFVKIEATLAYCNTLRMPAQFPDSLLCTQVPACSVMRVKANGEPKFVTYRATRIKHVKVLIKPPPFGDPRVRLAEPFENAIANATVKAWWPRGNQAYEVNLSLVCCHLGFSSATPSAPQDTLKMAMRVHPPHC